MKKLTREQAEQIVASRSSLCCGLKMHLDVVPAGSGLDHSRFTAWAKCEDKDSALDHHEAYILGELSH
jgi:hypothetical protein